MAAIAGRFTTTARTIAGSAQFDTDLEFEVSGTIRKAQSGYDGAVSAEGE